ncbi:MAG: FMN-binding protein [Gammaproteobacteria bacterium]|nr:FMN-binding protein [Gammaproteobacteria bacterium]
MNATTGTNLLKGMAVLVILAGIIIGALDYVHEATADRIEVHQNRAFWALAEELAGDSTLHESAHGSASRPEIGKPVRLKDGRLLGSTSTAGYGGDIELLILLNPDGSIGGVRTVRHAETPGIGDFIQGATPWMGQFRSLHSGQLDFIDGRTGATITVNAMRRGVRGFISTVSSQESEPTL